ncbi:MAG: GNAT family N-acetyltransferase, partial [Candidatus Omnitrophica bacterium]|nr:GNAT family N-acetyltransferase [Candidatus Omnitrophota bacterium]
MRLFDALANQYSDTADPCEFAGSLIRRLDALSKFTRQGSFSAGEAIIITETRDFADYLTIVRNYGEQFHDLIHPAEGVTRFLGNTSFRAQYFFPGEKFKNIMFVSRRNIDKRNINAGGFVAVDMGSYNATKLEFYGEAKPSVDTPTQMRFLNALPNVNIILHSHVYILGAPFTEKMVPCGALEEVDEVFAAIGFDYSKTNFAVNLLGHGSIVFAGDLAYLGEHVRYNARVLPESLNTDGTSVPGFLGNNRLRDGGYWSAENVPVLKYSNIEGVLDTIIAINKTVEWPRDGRDRDVLIRAILTGRFVGGRHENIVWIAEKDGVGVGYLILTVRGKSGFIFYLAVDKGNRGKGIGSALLAEAFLYCQQSGIMELELQVNRTNTSAYRLYKRFGGVEYSGLFDTHDSKLNGYIGMVFDVMSQSSRNLSREKWQSLSGNISCARFSVMCEGRGYFDGGDTGSSVFIPEARRGVSGKIITWLRRETFLTVAATISGIYIVFAVTTNYFFSSLWFYFGYASSSWMSGLVSYGGYYQSLQAMFGEDFASYLFLSMILSIVSMVLGNIVSQKFEIEVKHDHPDFQWGRIQRASLMGIFIYPPFWGLVWYRWLLFAATGVTLNFLALPPLNIINPSVLAVLAVRWVLEMVFWAFLSLWFGIVAGMMIIERRSFVLSLQGVFRDETQSGWKQWQKYFTLVFCVNLPLWGIPKLLALMEPSHAFFLSQFFVIPSTALYSYVMYSAKTGNLWKAVWKKIADRRSLKVSRNKDAEKLLNEIEREGKDRYDGGEFSFSGKCAADEKLFQARQIKSSGFSTYELYLSPGDIKNYSEVRGRLERIYHDLELTCVSVHSPNALVTQPSSELIPGVSVCQELVSYLETIQDRAPSGVVLHELRGKTYSGFDSKLKAWERIYGECDNGIRVLTETPNWDSTEKEKLFLPFPLYLDTFVDQFKSRSNFGITFDFDHVFQSVYMFGLMFVQKPITDYAQFWAREYGNKNVLPGYWKSLEDYVEGEYGPLKDEGLDILGGYWEEKINRFAGAYNPVLSRGEIKAMRNYRKPVSGNWVTRQFGFDPRFGDDFNGSYLSRSGPVYPELIRRMLERYKKYIGLFHCTGTEFRAYYSHAYPGTFEAPTSDFVRFFEWLVYKNKAHIPPYAGAVSSLDLKPVLDSLDGSIPVILETMLPDDGELNLRWFQESDVYSLYSNQIDYSRDNDGGAASFLISFFAGLDIYIFEIMFAVDVVGITVTGIVIRKHKQEFYGILRKMHERLNREFIRAKISRQFLAHDLWHFPKKPKEFGAEEFSRIMVNFVVPILVFTIGAKIFGVGLPLDKALILTLCINYVMSLRNIISDKYYHVSFSLSRENRKDLFSLKFIHPQKLARSLFLDAVAYIFLLVDAFSFWLWFHAPGIDVPVWVLSAVPLLGQWQWFNLLTFNWLVVWYAYKTRIWQHYPPEVARLQALKQFLVSFLAVLAVTQLGLPGFWSYQIFKKLIVSEGANALIDVFYPLTRIPIKTFQGVPLSDTPKWILIAADQGMRIKNLVHVAGAWFGEQKVMYGTVKSEEAREVWGGLAQSGFLDYVNDPEEAADFVKDILKQEVNSGRKFKVIGREDYAKDLIHESWISPLDRYLGRRFMQGYDALDVLSFVRLLPVIENPGWWRENLTRHREYFEDASLSRIAVISMNKLPEDVRLRLEGRGKRVFINRLTGESIVLFKDRIRKLDLLFEVQQVIEEMWIFAKSSEVNGLFSKTDFGSEYMKVLKCRYT